MVGTMNSTQGYGAQIPLEPLNSLTSNNYNTPGTQPSYNTGLQSLDSIKANTYNNVVPNDNVLAPLDAMSPVMPEKDKSETKEKGALGFIGGVFKGVGNAAIDTAGGLVTFGKVVVGGIVKPKKTLQWVGGGIDYAFSHPGKAAKAVFVDLPIGLVKGVVNPYAEAIKQGKYGEAVGRGVFDVGLILLTAGLGEGNGAAKTGATTGAEVVDKIDDVADGVKYADEVAGGVKYADEAASGISTVTKGVEGGIHLGENAIKIGNVGQGAVININIGNTTATVTNTVGRVSNTAKVAAEAGATIEKVAKTATASVAAVETATAAGKVSAGIGSIFDTMGKGFSRIKSALKGSGVGAGLNNGLAAIVGEGAATTIKNGLHSIGQGLAKGGTVIKEGAKFVKAHPIPSALITGRVTSVVEEGMKANDYYVPKNKFRF